MTRMLCGIGLFFAILETLPAAPVPIVPNDPTKDREGNPLPKGATARLGSLSYRGPTTAGVTFSADGKRLLVVEHDRITRFDPEEDETQTSNPRHGRLHIWDTDTGRFLGTRSFEPDVSQKSIVSTCVVGERIITIVHDRVVLRKNDENTVKVVVAKVADGKEITHFDFAGGPGRSIRDYAFGETVFAGTFPMVEVSLSGKYMAIVKARDNTVGVYDLNSGKLLHTHQIETPLFAGVYISPDSKALFVFQDNKPLVRYELSGGKPLPAFAETEANIHGLAISPDGKKAVTWGYEEVRDPDQPRLRSRKSEDFLVVRDAANGQAVGRLPISGSIHAFQFVAEDAVLVSYSSTGSASDRAYISRWNITTFKKEWEKSIPRGVGLSQLKVSPDKKLFSLVGNQTVSLFDSLSGKPANPITTHTGPVQWIGFSSDGKTVTTAGGEELFVWSLIGERKQTIEIPEIERGRGRIPPGGSGDHLIWSTFSVDGKTTDLVAWDHDKSQIAWRLSMPGKKPANLLSHDGKRVIVIDWEEKWEDWQANVYDGPTGKMIDDWTVPYLPPKTLRADNTFGQLGPDRVNVNGAGPGGIGGVMGKNGPGGRAGGQAGGRNGPLPKGAAKGGGPGGGGGFPGVPDDFQMNLDERRMTDPRAKTGPSWCQPITLAGDGNMIFVAGNKVLGIDPIRGKKLVRIDSTSIDSISALRQGPLAASADGSRLAIGDQRALRIYNVKTEKLVSEFIGSFQRAEMKFSPAGDRLAVWSNSGTVVSLYDLSSKAGPLSLDGNLSMPTCTAFNPSGTCLAVGYQDGTSLIWDIAAKH
jgi:WD40 repeat protein